MKDKALQILKKLEANGYIAYIVGGFPRDLYLGIECHDIDICTNATSDTIKNLFEVVNTYGIKYGVVKIVYKNEQFEITTFRKESNYTRNRRPSKIYFVNDLLTDLKRRDFIMNTLCINSECEFVDLLGAKKDIDNCIINSVGNSFEKIEEDSLRILRAIRFATVLNFKLSDDLKKAIKKYSYLVENLSFSTRKKELDFIFSSSNVEYGISLLKELNLIKPLGFKDVDLIIGDAISIWYQLDVNRVYPYTKNELKKLNNFINNSI